MTHKSCRYSEAFCSFPYLRISQFFAFWVAWCQCIWLNLQRKKKKKKLTNFEKEMCEDNCCSPGWFVARFVW